MGFLDAYTMFVAGRRLSGGLLLLFRRTTALAFRLVAARGHDQRGHAQLLAYDVPGQALLDPSMG